MILVIGDIAAGLNDGFPCNVVTGVQWYVVVILDSVFPRHADDRQVQAGCVYAG